MSFWYYVSYCSGRASFTAITATYGTYIQAPYLGIISHNSLKHFCLFSLICYSYLHVFIAVLSYWKRISNWLAIFDFQNTALCSVRDVFFFEYTLLACWTDKLLFDSIDCSCYYVFFHLNSSYSIVIYTTSIIEMGNLCYSSCSWTASPLVLGHPSP